VLTEATSIPPDSVLEFDLCIVGAGPAGIAIADRLRDSPLKICLLESGGFEPEIRTQRLYHGENVGHPYFNPQSCRFRMFGGSSNRWGGWCRPLEDVDFEARDWLPWSGWPIAPEALKPYYTAAAELFQLPTPRFDREVWATRLPPPFPFESDEVESAIFQYSPETNFGELYRERLLQSPRVTVLLYGNVTEIRLDPGTDRVRDLRVQTLGGHSATIRARAVVLAAGGLENPRLLLASRHDHPAGLGNQHDLVGRFFMEHLHVPAGHLVSRQPDLSRDFYRKAQYDGFRARGVLIPTASAIRRHQLLSCSVAVEKAHYDFGTPFLEWGPEVNFGPVRLYRALRRGPFRAGAEYLKGRAERLYGIPRHLLTRRLARSAARRARDAGWPASPIYSLYFRTEQAPDPASRVTLGERRDALGVPEIRLDWKIGSKDFGSILGWLRIFDRTVDAAGIGRVLLPEEGWEARVIGGPHHMGTTRMAADSRRGVVDENCRVHGLANLYVAGSSVFTTGGYANPTLTLVALGLRLADHLKVELGR
jgi:choline dehydrogenase-like flavoprotein